MNSERWADVETRCTPTTPTMTGEPCIQPPHSFRAQLDLGVAIIDPPKTTQSHLPRRYQALCPRTGASPAPLSMTGKHQCTAPGELRLA